MAPPPSTTPRHPRLPSPLDAVPPLPPPRRGRPAAPPTATVAATATGEVAAGRPLAQPHRRTRAPRGTGGVWQTGHHDRPACGCPVPGEAGKAVVLVGGPPESAVGGGTARGGCAWRRVLGAAGESDGPRGEASGHAEGGAHAADPARRLLQLCPSTKQ